MIYPSGGVDTKLLTPRNKELNTKITIAYFGRIEEGKGWDCFLKAVQSLDQEMIRIKVAGFGREVNKMNEMIDRLKIKVDYVGPITYNEIPAFFENVHLMIFPTLREESLGLTALEAMSCGIPVIGSNLGAIPEYIDDEENGYLVQPNCPGAISDALEKYIELSKSDKIHMSENARKTAMKYSTERVQMELPRSFRNLL